VSDILIYYDEAMLGHNPTGWDPAHPEWTEAVKALLAEQYPDKILDEFSHPERPQRLTVIVDKLRAQPVAGTRWVRPEPAEPPELRRVHTHRYVDFIEALSGRACWLGVDTTAVSPGSVQAAKLAAGARVSAVEAIARGEAEHAFCLVRPPGHHALPERATGFCLYNNVAVAAAHAREALGWKRVLIWDWDLHHGNGTQAIFYQQPDVLFLDSHCKAPFYPGSGGLDEVGAGAGEGFTLTVPLPAGSGNATLLEVAERVVRPAAASFRPDLILVSAGFDPHHLDQTFVMDETGFAALTRWMCDIADEFAEGRLVLMQEGGYNAESLAESAHACIGVLAGGGAESVNVLQEDPGLAAVEAVAEYHAARIAALGKRGIFYT
jgi:acetoin utilization deacetylase AcuC-like enzyme